jgi:AcrR family transcriptional regulator
LKTKELILDTAIRLFNEKGTAAVSTNQVAEVAGISPGNLYYHYTSKEDIIRGIFERMFALWDITFDLPADHQPRLDDIQYLFQKNFEIMWAYRFAYRELPALLRRDDELRQRYITVRQRGFDGFQQLFASFTAAGLLVPVATPQTVADLAEVIWLISEFWLSRIEVSGQEVDPPAMQRGVNLMMQVLHPYLVDSSMAT